MLIEHRQYLAILDQLDFLKKDNQLLREQNHILTQQLYKEKQQRLQLENHHHKNIQLIQQLHAKTFTHQSDNTKSIIETITQCNTATKTFLQTKFQILQNATSDEAKQNELKQAKNKLDFYELNDFSNKIRALYKESQASDTTQNTKPTFGSIVKWIRGLAQLCSTQQKLGMFVSSSTTNLKKQGGKRQSKLKENSDLRSGGRQSKLKENIEIFNGIESKSKIIMGDPQKSKNII